MAAAYILEDFVQQVTWLDPFVLEIPQMMMRVADRQVGFKGVFGDLGKPFVIRPHVLRVLSIHTGIGPGGCPSVS